MDTVDTMVDAVLHRSCHMTSAFEPRPSGFPALWVATLALTAMVVGCWNLAVPGLQHDETLFCNAALGGPTDAFVCQRWLGIPLLLMPYVGALKAWIYAPIFAMLPVDPWTIRLPAVVIGVAGGSLLVWAVYLFFGRRAALFAAPLILLDPSLIMHSRLDWGPTAVMFLARGAVIAGVALWWRTGTPAGMWLVLAAGALGIFDKLNFVWILAAVVAAVAVVFFAAAVSSCRRYPLVSLVQGGGLMSTLFLGAWRSVIVSGGMQTAGYDWGQRLAAAGRLLGLALVGGGPLHVVCGDGMAAARWMVPALACAAAVAMAVNVGHRGSAVDEGGPRAGWRPLAFLAVFTCLLVAAFVGTKLAEGPHHAAVVTGLPGMLLAPLLAAGCGARSSGPTVARLRTAAATAAAAILSGAMLASSVLSLDRFARPTNPHWDPAISQLAAFADAHPDAVLRTVDWGMANQVIALTRCRVNPVDRWQDFLTIDGARAALRTGNPNGDLFLCMRAEGKETFPASRQNALDALRELRIDAEQAASFPGVDGRPLLEVLVIHPTARPWIRAQPNPVPFAGEKGTTTITWDAAGADGATVYLRGADKEELFSGGCTGKETIDWIAPGGVYEFVLYADADRKQELATLEVTRPAK